MSGCPFCQAQRDIDIDRIIVKSEHAIAFFDPYPASNGHAIVTPRRHVANLFELNPEEIADTWALLKPLREFLLEEHQPDGFTIGVNENKAAGQGVPHAAINMIPRYLGDVSDPRRGVRAVMESDPATTKT